MAEEFYSKAIKINPTRYGPLYKNRGIVRLQLKKNQAAKEDFQDSAQLPPPVFLQEFRPTRPTQAPHAKPREKKSATARQAAWKDRCEFRARQRRNRRTFPQAQLWKPKKKYRQ